MKKEMSLSKEKLILHTLYGAVWIVYGILKMFDHAIVNFIAAVVLFVPVLLRVVYVAKEGVGLGDEMSDYHMMKAKAETLEILAFIAILLFLFQEVFELAISLPFLRVSVVSVGAFIVGIKEFLVGILFAKYEKEGE